MPSICTSSQPRCSGLQRCNFGGSTRPGRASLRTAANKRNSGFLEHSGILPCHLHRSSPCRCQASDSNGKPGMLFGLKNPFRGLRFGNQGGDAETSQADQESQQQPAADKAQPVDNSMPWRAWTQHFDAMDYSAQSLAELDTSLATATALERFQEAASLKKKIDDLNAGDAVEEVLEGVRAAVEAEDYAQAASLRDQGAVGLQGWWVADNKEDPKGHLLRIATGFGRYIGFAYTPQDLAQAEGLPTDENAAMLHQFEEVQQCPMDEVGTPVLELFLKKDTNGELQQQGTVLSIPPEVLSQAQSRMAQLTTELSADKVWVDEGKDETGGSVISISLTMPDKYSKSNSAQASRPSTSQGSWFGRPSSSGQIVDASESDTFGSAQVGPGEVIDLERYPATIAQTGRDQLEVTVHPQSLTQTVNQEWETEDADDSDSDEDTDSDDEDSNDSSRNLIAVLESASSSTVEVSDAGTGVQSTLVYEQLFPGRIINPSDLEDEAARAAALIQQEMADDGDQVLVSGTRIEHDNGSIEYRVDDVKLASTSSSNDEESGSKEDKEEEQSPSWETVVSNVLQVVQQLKSFAPKPGESKEDQTKHADLMKKLDEAEKSLTSKSQSTDNTKPDSASKAQALTQEQLIEALRSAQAKQQSGELPVNENGDTIQDIVQELAGKALKQALPEILEHIGAADRNPIMQATSGEAEGALKTMKYRRLDTSFVSTDPFTGLYLAAFGSHGPEVLQLQREQDPIDDTVEWVTGTKLTGDSNVPAGEVSFKAKIGRGSRLGTPDVYPPEMGVLARYRGSGCVAQGGFQQPSWVDGELLHFSGDGATTRGAELGFVWTGNQNHFLVILKRIDLSEEE